MLHFLRSFNTLESTPAVWPTRWRVAWPWWSQVCRTSPRTSMWSSLRSLGPVRWVSLSLLVHGNLPIRRCYFYFVFTINNVTGKRRLQGKEKNTSRAMEPFLQLLGSPSPTTRLSLRCIVYIYNPSKIFYSLLITIESFFSCRAAHELQMLFLKIRCV